MRSSFAAIKAESGYIRLESELAELDLRLAALGAGGTGCRRRSKKTAQQLRDRLQEEIRRFKEDNTAPWQIWWRKSPPAS